MNYFLNQRQKHIQKIAKKAVINGGSPNSKVKPFLPVGAVQSKKAVIAKKAVTAKKGTLAKSNFYLL